MAIKGLIFDKDGTLFDFRATWDAWLGGLLDELAAGDAGRQAALADAIGYDLSERRLLRGSVFVAGTNRETVARLMPHLPDWTPGDLVARMAVLGARAQPVGPIDLPPYLSGLRAAGYALAVVTNDAAGSARRQLETAGIDAAFAEIIGFDSGYEPKPAPDMCLAAAEGMMLDPGDCVMIGDSTHDLHAGRGAGMRTVAVLTGIAPEDELAPHADAVMPDIGHLPGWLSEAARGPGR